MVLAAQEGMDQAMHSVPWEEKRGAAPQDATAAESLGETLGEQLVPLMVCSLSLLQELGLCFLAVLPAERSQKELKI